VVAASRKCSRSSWYVPPAPLKGGSLFFCDELDVSVVAYSHVRYFSSVLFPVACFHSAAFGNSIRQDFVVTVLGKAAFVGLDGISLALKKSQMSQTRGED
jgi:hypothetical protein